MTAVKPQLWLKGDQGVVVDTSGGSNAAVAKWESLQPAQPATFTLSSAAEHESKHVRHAHPTWAALPEDSCVRFVQFGCSLVSSAVKLAPPMTAYLAVRLSTQGPRGAVQRLFGTFPNGGAVFDGTRAGFKTRQGVIVARGGKAGDAAAAAALESGPSSAFRVFKWRVGMAGVEIGEGLGRFLKAGTAHDAEFTDNPQLTIGGTNAGCEFDGAIGEVLVFNSLINDNMDAVASGYMIKRWVVSQAKEGPASSVAATTPGSAAAGAGPPIAGSTSASGCVRYSDGVPGGEDVFAWLPPVEGTTLQQRVEWDRLVRTVHAGVARAAPASRNVAGRRAKAELKRERARLFGEPCKDAAVPTYATALGEQQGSASSQPHQPPQYQQQSQQSQQSQQQHQQQQPQQQEQQQQQPGFVFEPAQDSFPAFATNFDGPAAASWVDEEASHDAKKKGLHVGLVPGPGGAGRTPPRSPVRVPPRTPPQRRTPQQPRPLPRQQPPPPVTSASPDERQRLDGVLEGAPWPSRAERAKAPASAPLSAAMSSALSAAPGSKSGGCNDVQRPETNDILSWKPPSAGALDARYAWEDAVEAATKEVAKFTQGGDALQALLKRISRQMHALRDHLFGNVCDDQAPAHASPDRPQPHQVQPRQQVPSQQVSGQQQQQQQQQQQPQQQQQQQQQQQHHQQQQQEQQEQQQQEQQRTRLRSAPGPGASAATDASAASAPGSRVCVKHKGEDIMAWQPPSAAPADAKWAWQDAVESATAQVGKFSQGGDVLDRFLKGLVRELARTRLALFARYCDDLQ